MPVNPPKVPPVTKASIPIGCSRGCNDEGSISIFVAVLLPALLLLAGLVVDGANQLTAYRAAHDTAEQAARAASNSLSVTALRAGDLQVDPDAARRAAQSYLIAAGTAGNVTVDATTVTVTVTEHTDTSFLGLIGIHHLSATGSASAQLLRGITTGETS